MMVKWVALYSDGPSNKSRCSTPALSSLSKTRDPLHNAGQYLLGDRDKRLDGWMAGWLDGRK